MFTTTEYCLYRVIIDNYKLKNFFVQTFYPNKLKIKLHVIIYEQLWSFLNINK